MTDQTIPAVTDNDLRVAHEWAASIDPDMNGWSDRERAAARVILDAVPAPPLQPHLAGTAMTHTTPQQAAAALEGHRPIDPELTLGALRTISAMQPTYLVRYQHPMPGEWSAANTHWHDAEERHPTLQDARNAAAHKSTYRGLIRNVRVIITYAYDPEATQ